MLMRRSVLFGWLSPLLRMGAFAAPGNAAYAFVGRHRSGLGTLSAALLPMRDTTFEVSRRWYRVDGLFVVLVFVWNLHTIRVLPAISYHEMAPVFRVFARDQLWNMFVPSDSREVGEGKVG